jgi:hypothetical protein
MIKLLPFLYPQFDRPCIQGCGGFGDSRSGGTRSHKGIDFLTKPGQIIFAPFKGVLKRKDYLVYSDPSKRDLVGIEFENDKGVLIQVFYCKTNLPVGYEFEAGQAIAIAQDMQQFYSPGMPNHIHVQILINGAFHDFAEWFGRPAGTAIAITLMLATFAAIGYKLSTLEQ